MIIKHKRSIKHLLLKRNLQGKLTLAIFLSGLGACVSIILLMAFFSADTLTISYSDSAIQMASTPFMLLKNTLTANWILVVLGGSLPIIAGIVGTHQIAGPLFRFENTLQLMKNGNLKERISLRKKDEGKELAQHINNFNTLLSNNLSTIGKCTQSIDQLIHQYDACSNTISKEELQMIFHSIRVKNDRIQEILNRYTLQDG